MPQYVVYFNEMHTDQRDSEESYGMLQRYQLFTAEDNSIARSQAEQQAVNSSCRKLERKCKVVVTGLARKKGGRFIQLTL